MSEVSDKTVVITGAGSGIGRETALLFGRRGAFVVVSDVDGARAEDTAEQIRSADGRAEVVLCDVSDFRQVEDLVGKTVERRGRIDVMVNNAGIGPSKMRYTAEHTLDDWDRVIAVNQTGVFYGMKLALARMEAQGGGRIVNVASLAGLKASGKNLSYTASKFAVVGMTKAAALEYAARNIRINAVCPGYTHSALLDQLLSARPDMAGILRSVIPMKRFGEASEIAGAICWLALDAPDFITGHALVLDGGTSL